MKTLVVAGDPINHSLSPTMHNAAFEALDINDQYVYKRLLVNQNNLGDFIQKMRLGNIYGANLTLPLKQQVFSYLERVSSVAQTINAVNTIILKENELYGTNTDADGFILSLKDKVPNLTNKRTLVLGAGGAAYAVCYSLLQEKSKIMVFNRTQQKTLQLISHFKNFGSIQLMKEINVKNIDLLINCTSVGLDKVSSPIAYDLLHFKLIVVDIVYNPLKTPLLQEAEKIGCLIIDGVGMLIHQGAIAFKLFTGLEAPIEIMKRAVYNKLHVIAKN